MKAVKWGAIALGLVLLASPAWANSYYVRGDGSGSDTNDGSAWSSATPGVGAFATLQKALDSIPWEAANDPSLSSGAHTIYVQASSGAQAYDVAKRTVGYTGSAGRALDMEFQGGWTNVDVTAVQSGVSVIKDLDGGKDESGIQIDGGGHYTWKRVVVNQFDILDVKHGINIDTPSSMDRADVVVTVTDTDIVAQQWGVRLNYPKPYTSTGWGGPCQITAQDVDIVAGQGGSTGDGIYIRGAWMGSSIGASAGEFSTVTSAQGSGVWFSAVNNETHDATFEDLVVYNCSAEGIHLDADRDGTNLYRVQGTLENCTIADNGGDGLEMAGRTSNSWANVTDSIFANNGGSGIDLGESGYSNFTCTENHNILFGDDIVVCGTAQALDANDFATDPLFYGGTAPYPYYRIASTGSPAYLSDNDGLMRGAVQDVPPVPEPAGLGLVGLALLGLKRKKRS